MYNMLLNNYMEAATMSEISREDAMELLLKSSGGYQFEEKHKPIFDAYGNYQYSTDIIVTEPNIAVGYVSYQNTKL